MAEPKHQAVLLLSYQSAVMPPYTPCKPLLEMTPPVTPHQEPVKRKLFTEAKLKQQRIKRKKFRERKKAQKAEMWMKMCSEALKKRWRERSEKYQHEREQEIREKEIECNLKREVLASALEKTAVHIRSTSIDVQTINDNFISVATELEENEAGTLNLPACTSGSCASSTNKVRNLEERVVTYREMAEQFKAKNRRLRVETSEKVEAVRNFWRNNVLEERTRAGRMVMMAVRKGASTLPSVDCDS